jgi:hypothetical protein
MTHESCVSGRRTPFHAAQTRELNEKLKIHSTRYVAVALRLRNLQPLGRQKGRNKNVARRATK